MSPVTLLRVSSLLTLLFAAGHTAGAFQQWSPVGETDVLGAMRTFRFDAGGASRTYLEFYLGFGLLVSVYLTLQAVLLWQVASLASADPKRTRPLVASFIVASLAGAVLSWRFIFNVPTISFGLIAVFLGVALYATHGPRPAGEPPKPL